MAEEAVKEKEEKREPDESKVSEKASEKEPKKKKSKKALILFTLILAIPAGVLGLHMSGVWDGRPVFYSVVPKLPYVGKPLTKFFSVPEKYLLSAPERRMYELKEWEDEIASREKAVSDLESKLQSLSSDLQVKYATVRKAEAELAQKELEMPKAEMTQDEKATFDRVVRTYQEISARKAASIVENLDGALAVRILRALPEEDGANILGRMDAAKAAWLTEQLAK